MGGCDICIDDSGRDECHNSPGKKEAQGCTQHRQYQRLQQKLQQDSLAAGPQGFFKAD